MNHQIKQKKSKKNISVGRISYINVAPVYYGLDRSLRPQWFNMVTEPPNVLNKMMSDEVIDISPVSAAAYAEHHRDWLVLPDLSIGCDGEVLSVIVASRVPLAELDGKKVVLTNESATSSALLKLFFARRGVKPLFETGRVDTPENLPDDADAALIIGDSALSQSWERSHPYVHDLGEMWKEMTGLPFVFALWVVRKKFALENSSIVLSAIEAFNSSRQSGEENLEEIICRASEKTGITCELSRKYFDVLDCYLNSESILGLETFFSQLFRYNILKEEVTLNFFE